MLEGRLEDWVKNASKAGKVLTDQLLRRKAREFGDAMGFTQDKFKASSGWLENFKHRHGIRRGVWYGNGTLDQKYRAYANDFVPDEPQPIIPFPGTASHRHRRRGRRPGSRRRRRREHPPYERAGHAVLPRAHSGPVG